MTPVPLFIHGQEPDPTIPFDLDVVLTLQTRSRSMYDLARLYAHLTKGQSGEAQQNDAANLSAHMRIALARHHGQAPDPYDLELTGLTWQRGERLAGRPS